MEVFIGLIFFAAYLVFIGLMVMVLIWLLKTLKNANEYLEIKIKDSKNK